MAQKIRKPIIKKNRTNLGTGVVHIQSTFNNTIVMLISNINGLLLIIDIDTTRMEKLASSGDDDSVLFPFDI